MHHRTTMLVNPASPSRRTTRLLRLAACLGALAAHATAAADSITLRASVRVPHGSTVTLADIASIDGAAAENFAGMDIGRADAGAFEVSADMVRQKLAAAGADLSRITLAGGSSVVRPLRGRTAEPDAVARTESGARTGRSAARRAGAGAETAVETAAAGGQCIEAAAHDGLATPLGLVATLFVNAFPDERATLRIALRPSDLALLEPKPGLRHEVVAKGSLRSDRVELEIIALRGNGEIVSRERIRAEPKLARTVLVTRCDARRGGAVTDATVAEARFVAPSVAEHAADSASSAIAGTTFSRTVPEGSVVETDDLAREIAVRRNERVMVRREVGLVAIEIEAVALEDGSSGDVIALEHVRPGRRGGDAEPISAEIVGRGRAVIRSGPATLASSTPTN